MSEFQMAYVHKLQQEAKGIISVELRPIEGKHFVAFKAGAYINVYLPNDLVRSYSLLNSPDDRDRYTLTVLLDSHSRGGSAYIHQLLKIGDQLKISLPHNNFILNEYAVHTVLVAGGIGITPLFCMLNRLIKWGRSVELIYCTRSRKEAAFLEELCKVNEKVTYHFDDEQKILPNFKKYLTGYSAGTYFYCSGPIAMLKAFEQTCHQLGYVHTQTELFSVNDLLVGKTSPIHSYQVVLAKSKKILDVMVGKSLLETLLENDIKVNCACREGVCGTCKTKVLDGVPYHRDGVLSDKQKQANDVMMVCVSGCKSDRIVLDL